MQDSTLHTLAKIDKSKNYAPRTLYFMGGNFRVDYNTIIYKLEKISLNNVDMDCEQEDIYKGPFRIRFDKEILLERGNIKECTWDEDDKILKINDEEIRYIDTDLIVFTLDLHADLENGINNLMEYFCEWVKRNYM